MSTKKSSRQIMAGTDAFWWHKGDNSYRYMCTFSFDFSCDVERVEKEYHNFVQGGFTKYIDEVQTNKKIELRLNGADWDDAQPVYEAWNLFFQENGKNHAQKMFARDEDFEDMAHLFFRFLKGFRWGAYIRQTRPVPSFSQEELDSQERARRYAEQERALREAEDSKPRYSERVLFEDYDDWVRDRTRY
jgi:hypothetical protein